jgi:hypothetical protein
MQITRHKLQLCHHFNDFDLRHQSRHDLPALRHHYQLHSQHPEGGKLQMTLFNSIKDTFEALKSSESSRWVV